MVSVDESEPGQYPVVSVIVATRNEADAIGACLTALAGQTYPQNRIDVLLVDGASEDGTVHGAGAVARDLGLPIRLIDNPRRVTAAAFNRGIEAAAGQVIVILGARARVDPDFVRASVAALRRTGANAVGGVVRTVGGTDGVVARAVALAQRSPFGVGDAHYRYAENEAEVDTVNYGAYRREVFDHIGGFDESLHWVEDDEFNYRLRAAGGRLVLNPAIAVEYLARPSLRSLWRQRFLWGYNKPRVAVRHPAQMRARHAIPALFVLALIGGAAAALKGGRWRWPLVSILSAYTAAALVASARLGARYGWRPETALLPAAFATMHLAYGSGTLAGTAALAFGAVTRLASGSGARRAWPR